MHQGTLLLLIAVSCAVPLRAQQPDAGAAAGRVRRALATPSPPIAFNASLPPLVVQPGARRFGILTLTPPQTNGEIVRVNVPVGELVMHAVVGGVANANHRRLERKAHEEVMRALAEFRAQQSHD